MNMLKKTNKKNTQTNWNNVADWYDGYLSSSDTYQSKVIQPNLTRLLNPVKSDKIIEIACGQGFFTNLFAQTGATVLGIDASKLLIDKALSKKGTAEYKVLKANNLSGVKDLFYNKAYIVLALENIKEIDETCKEIRRILTHDGLVYIVLMHPAFRIPKESGWGYGEQLQFRAIATYMSEKSYEIVMNPGEHNKYKQITTVSFHRPLQWYMKIFKKNGFVISGLEEWISHKESSEGPKKKEEDRARKEIPMFLCLELRKK